MLSKSRISRISPTSYSMNEGQQRNKLPMTMSSTTPPSPFLRWWRGCDAATRAALAYLVSNAVYEVSLRQGSDENDGGGVLTLFMDFIGDDSGGADS